MEEINEVICHAETYRIGFCAVRSGTQTMPFYAHRGYQGSVTHGMTVKEHKFCVREFDKKNDHHTPQRGQHTCVVLLFCHIVESFLRSIIYGIIFRPNSADKLNELPQRGVSKIWHCPRLIHVYTYPFRSIQFVAAQTLCALQFVTFLLGRTKHK